MFYQYLYKESTFGDQIRTLGTAILVCSLPMKSKKRQLVMYLIFFPTLDHTSLVQDITDSDCWPQKFNGSTHGHNYCPNFQTSLFNKENEKSRQNCCVYVLYSVLINKISSVWFPCSFNTPVKTNNVLTDTETSCQGNVENLFLR